MAPIYADLHVHSTASDGVLSPTALVKASKEAGLAAIALTDHDTVDGIPEGLAAASECGLKLISGIEFSCGWPDNELPLHVLGLFIDHLNPCLHSLLNGQKRARYTRAFRILERLESLKINVEPLRKTFLNDPEKLLGRPHIARFLIETGVVAEFQEAFERFLRRGAPAHVAKPHLLPEQAIETIHQAGGMAFIAHPGLIHDFDSVWSLIGALPWDGMEVFYSEHDAEKTEYFYKFAQERGLLVTGGSDYHGECGKHASKLGVFGLDRPGFETLMDGVEKAYPELSALSA